MARSRRGCLTCRIRRVKCDESLPVCIRCKDTKRTCEGPSRDKYTFVVQSKTARQPKLRSHNSRIAVSRLPIRVAKPTTRDPVESRAFDYFLICVAPSLAGGFDSDFWTFILPQICERDPAIWHAVLAISDLYEHPPEHRWATQGIGGPRASEIKSLQALTWYNRSLSQSRNLTSDIKDSEKAQLAMLSCVLFASLEFQQNNVQNALRLLGRGYDVFAMAIQTMDRASFHTPLIEDILMPMFTRHVVQMACFGITPPLSWAWAKRFHDMSRLELGPIMSLREARRHLYHIVCLGLELIHATGTLVGGRKEGTLEKLKKQQEAVLGRIRSWYHDFHRLLEDIGPSLGQVQNSAASSLLMYFYVTEIWTMNCLEPSPMRFDDHQHRFKKIIRHAEESMKATRSQNGSNPPPFSFEIGVIPPLYFTGWNCHHPLIRRKALDLIRRAPAQEALFNADLNYRAVKATIEIEEGPNHLPIDLPEYEACIEAGSSIVLPKEEDRVRGAAVHYENINGEKEPPSLIYTKGTWAGGFAWEQEHSTVPI